MHKLILVLLSVVNYVLPTSLVAAEVPTFVKIDYPENRNDVHIEQVSSNWQFVVTSGLGALVSVYADQDRIWKSQPIMEYFAMMPSLKKADIDGNGEMDAILTSFTPHAGCIDFGAIYSLNGGKQNYLVHVNTSLRAHKDQLYIEVSERLPDSVVEYHVEDTIKGCGWSTESKGVIAFAEMLREHRYTVLGTAQQAFPKLQALYPKAMALYKKNQLGSAMSMLQEFFDRYDYRRVDPENKNGEYTLILNNYGFLLSEKYREEIAIPVLQYVINRAPERTITYLNIADAEYYFYDANDPRTYEIRPGVDINLPGGGTDISRNRKIKGHPDAPIHYRKYHDLMVASGKKDKIPPRVFERMK
ncbi:MAG: hypothetical protein AABY83_14550 [Pseudomonadota bacterium]